MSAAPQLLTPDEVVATALRPADAPDPEPDAPWEITDRGAAEWAIARMRQEHQSYLADVAPTLSAIDALRQEIERLEGFVDDRADKRNNTTSFFEAKLTSWLRDLQRQEGDVPDTKRTKSVRLAGGVVKSTAGRDSVVIADPGVFTLLHGDDSPFVKVTRDPVKAAVMDHVKATKGEVPAGAVIERGDTTYTVTLDAS